MIPGSGPAVQSRLLRAIVGSRFALIATGTVALQSKDPPWLAGAGPL